MDFIQHALERFKKIVDDLECACDDAYGVHCTVHDDRRFAKLALDKYETIKDKEIREHHFATRGDSSDG